MPQCYSDQTALLFNKLFNARGKECTPPSKQDNVTLANDADFLELPDIKSKSLSDICNDIKNADKEIQLLNTLEYLTSHNIQVDVKQTLGKSPLDEVHTKDVSLDLDSVMITMDGVQDKVLNEILSEVDKAVWQPDSDPTYGKDIQYEKLVRDLGFPKNIHESGNPLNPYAVAIVKLANDNAWIQGSDLNMLVPVNNSLYCKVSIPGTPQPTVGFRYYRNHEENENIYCLPVPTSCDPIHGWFRINSRIVIYEERLTILHRYMQCVRDIASAICYHYKPSNYFNMIYIFSANEEGTYRNDGKCPGGMWIHRLAFIMLSSMLRKDGPYTKKDCRPIYYIEETFHGKARVSTIQIQNKDVLKQGSNILLCSQQSTNDIVEKMFSSASGSDYTMLRFYSLGIVSGTCMVGIGLQFEVIRMHKNEGEYSTLYPVQRCQDKNGDGIIIQDYIVGGLCRGLSGFIETSKYVSYAITGDKSTVPKVQDIPMNVKSFVNDEMVMKKRKRNGQIKENTVEEYPTIFARHQVYNSSFRSSEGESLLSYPERLSTKLHFCSSFTHKRLFDDDSTNEFEVTDINVAALSRNINKYEEASKRNLCLIATKPGFRQEVAYIVRHNSNESSLWKNSPNREAMVSQALKNILHKPINLSLQTAGKRTELAEVKDVVTYMSYTVNAYIFLYKLSLQTLLKPDLSMFDRNSVCLFLKFVQDYLAIFYSGKTEPKQYEQKAYEYGGVRKVRATYKYSVHRKKLATTLCRPFILLPTIPAVLKESMLQYMFTDQVARLLANNILSDKGFILTQPLNSLEASRRHTQFEYMKENGYDKNAGVIYQCQNPKCTNKFHFSLQSLHLHLAVSKICKFKMSHSCEEKEDPCNLEYRYTIEQEEQKEQKQKTYETTHLSPEVVQAMHKIIEEACNNASSDHYLALRLVREGKSVYINGDGGSGKSYLGRLLQKQCLMIWGDWVVRIHGREKVFGLAFQGQACVNMGPLFTTIHKYLGITNFTVLDNNLDEEEMRKFAKENLQEDVKTKNRLLKTEVLIIDEVGNIHDALGRWLVIYLKEARNSEAPFGGVQVIAMGQVTQGLPPEEKNVQTESNRQLSWGMNAELNDYTRHINLSTMFRSDSDTELRRLIQAARHGKLTLHDIETFKTCGKNVKNAMQDPNRNVQESVTELCYKLTDVAGKNKDFIQKHFPNQRSNTPHSQTLILYARDIINELYVGEKYEGSKRDYPKHNKYSYVMNNYNAGDSFDSEFQNQPAELQVYIGMPVILTSNVWSTDLRRTHNFAKGTQGVVKGFFYKSEIELDSSEEVIASKNMIADQEIEAVMLLLTLTSECGTIFYQYHKSKRIKLNAIRVPYLTLNERERKSFSQLNQEYRTCKVVREQFGFTYGKNLSVSSIQGKTMNMVYFNLKTNYLVTGNNNNLNISALWYVILGRVQTLDNIWVEFPDGTNLKNYMRFFNCVDQRSVNFEIDWIQKTQNNQSQHIIKAKDPIALHDMQRQNFFRNMSFGEAVENSCHGALVMSEENKKKDESLRDLLMNLLSLIMFSVHCEHDVGFLLQEKFNLNSITKDRCKRYDDKLQETMKELNVNPKAPTTVCENLVKLVVCKTKVLFAKNDESDDVLEFKFMDRNTYYSIGKIQWMNLKTAIAQVDSSFEDIRMKKEIILKDSYLRTVIEPELKDLEPDAKNQMQQEAARNAQRNAEIYFDEESVYVATCSEQAVKEIRQLKILDFLSPEKTWTR